MGPENMGFSLPNVSKSNDVLYGKIRKFLDISCEEVVRLLLQEKDGIKLDIVERRR